MRTRNRPARGAALAIVRRAPVPRWVQLVAMWRERGTPAAFLEADLALFRRVAGYHSPVGDLLLPRLSRMANHSVLWTVIAFLLGALGGRFGRRAGMRGMISILGASAIANVPAKLIARRARPDLAVVPIVRRLAKLPITSSFPSGHSASAFAFATGASLEKPVLASVLFPVAGAVAYSRVYTGVHYPSDVLVGSALGAGVAFATRRWWPVAPEQPAEARRVLTHVDDRPGSDGQGLTIVVNPGAGHALAPNPAAKLREELPGADVIQLEEGADLREVLEKAAPDAVALGVAGGDGSVNTAAAVAHAHGKPLLVVPGGTLNHFARDLGLASVDDAIRAVRSGHAVAVDLGEMAGVPFVNSASFGSYADLVDARERLEGRIGKWPAVFIAMLKVMRRAEPVDVSIDGRPHRVWMVFIGNCHYHPRGLTPSWRSRMDDGRLDIRVVDGSEPYARLRLVWALLTGTLTRSSVFREMAVSRTVRVRSLEGPLRLARDGETRDGPEEFTIGKSATPLVVFAPRES